VNELYISVGFFVVTVVVVPMITFMFKQNSRIVRLEDNFMNFDFIDLRRTMNKIDKDLAVIMSHFDFNKDKKKGV